MTCTMCRLSCSQIVPSADVTAGLIVLRYQCARTGRQCCCFFLLRDTWLHMCVELRTLAGSNVHKSQGSSWNILKAPNAAVAFSHMYVIGSLSNFYTKLIVNRRRRSYGRHPVRHVYFCGWLVGTRTALSHPSRRIVAPGCCWKLSMAKTVHVWF